MADKSPEVAAPRDPLDHKADDTELKPGGEDGDVLENDQSAESPKPPASDDGGEEGEVSENSPTPSNSASASASAPPLPDEPLPEEQPAQEDDGWDFDWNPTHQAYFFYNRITGETTWENPRVPTNDKAQAPVPASAPGTTSDNTQLQTPPATAVPPINERPPAGGYNPAIHGDYDPNAWYAKNLEQPEENETAVMDTAAAYAAIGTFNRFSGKWQGGDQNPERHSDEAKSRRQMNAFFDVDAAANAHEGRSLKAERSGKKPTKGELKYFKEKRRAKKEEKRRAWLRD